MSVRTSDNSFSPLVSLGDEVHEIANCFCRQHSGFARAEQVYLNTLAVYAVNYFLRSHGIDTDLEASDSWNPIKQSFMDAADLVVKGRGKLECCSVMPGESLAKVSKKITGRIAFVFVEIDADMSEAKLLGFAKKLTDTKLSLSALCSVEDLPEYLESVRFLQFRFQS